jgi:hypothetical protein
MGGIFVRLLVIAGTLLLSGNLASAGSLPHCAGFATAAISNVQKIRAAGRSPSPGGDSLSCGHNLQDPFWSPDRDVQWRWCMSVSDETADKRSDEMREAVGKCSYCNIYARTVTSAAADNIKFGCGLKNDGDTRWTADLDSAFTGCLATQFCEDSGCVLGICDTYCTGDLSSIQRVLNPIVEQVTSAVAQCKAEKGIGTSSSALSVPKTIPPLQDKIDRPKRAATPAKKCQSPTATKGCNTGGLATVKPAPKGGSNTSAMDRLSGDSQLPSSSNSGGKTGGAGGSGGRLPTSGGASAVAKPVTSAPAPKADPTVDFGKCATCGKPPPPPIR